MSDPGDSTSRNADSNDNDKHDIEKLKEIILNAGFSISGIKIVVNPYFHLIGEPAYEFTVTSNAAIPNLNRDTSK
ncbi:MAG: hypothetical protein PHX80_03895 [Candidatus Nanoarchaeia archaeon]|nr:hypothetical protein [Candidatus Nanoarchaeia archaeon]